MSEQQGVFINGRAQVIEMLQYMQPGERDRLLKNISARNPQLAQELIEETYSFINLEQLGDDILKVLPKYVDSKILGIALKNSHEDFQRKVLGLAPRHYAESAYQAMTTFFENEASLRERSRKKIIRIVADLKRKNVM